MVDDEVCCSCGDGGDGVSKRKVPLDGPEFPERESGKPVGARQKLKPAARGAGRSNVSVPRPERVWSKGFTLLAWGMFFVLYMLQCVFI